ncbi:MAG TPA: type I-E CRISPR-associated protein Cas5/CasD [Rectinema sp.]|nr:type I-E CRISPR-associated protein Cas5/CasD [Rectinema sp.]HOO02549.1 type I-E CRISPR-associated protein Cas5/CasD [Rectinema sp.]HPW02056.1 type I-E CRISPR-associated protein Cas5/CasD [Rectinema sp.]HPW46911.1 type I-E CRISPR-associated protein Cas5/CasD [Rectinema sp.]HQN03460.1 type I-E CRISPR-associated protein Cas5/CasD [Rectinema sp.]
MSSEIGYLALRLQGPLQSWGYSSHFNRRSTSTMPTKSAIAGICCAAFGYERGSPQEKQFISGFALLSMIAISIPRRIEHQNKQYKWYQILQVNRLQDYHTVQNTRRADGSINDDCVVTHRSYITDAIFGVVLSGNKEFLEEIAGALEDPVWGLWLGRKSCLPSAPILAGNAVHRGGVKNTQEEALSLLIGDKDLNSYSYQEEVGTFLEGSDSIPDSPLCFDSKARQFTPRRIKSHEAIK